MIFNNLYSKNIKKLSDHLKVRPLRFGFQDSLKRTIVIFINGATDYNNSRIAVDSWFEIMGVGRFGLFCHIKSLTRAKKALETYIV